MAYTKTIWQIDDVITADKLNNIEEGIKSVEDNGLTIGTTASTAKAGNYQPTTANISDASTIGKTILTASDATAVRTTIGAGTGTSNLAIGTTASTAAAGNHNHAITANVDSGLGASANLQAAFVALSARVKALEDAVVE